MIMYDSSEEGQCWVVDFRSVSRFGIVPFEQSSIHREPESGVQSVRSNNFATSFLAVGVKDEARIPNNQAVTL